MSGVSCAARFLYATFASLEILGCATPSREKVLVLTSRPDHPIVYQLALEQLKSKTPKVVGEAPAAVSSVRAGLPFVQRVS